MACPRKQSPRQVIPPHRPRPKSPQGRDPAMGPPARRHHQHPRSLKENPCRFCKTSPAESDLSSTKNSEAWNWTKNSTAFSKPQPKKRCATASVPTRQCAQHASRWEARKPSNTKSAPPDGNRPWNLSGRMPATVCVNCFATPASPASPSSHSPSASGPTPPSSLSSTPSYSSNSPSPIPSSSTVSAMGRTTVANGAASRTPGGSSTQASMNICATPTLPSSNSQPLAEARPSSTSAAPVPQMLLTQLSANSSPAATSLPSAFNPTQAVSSRRSMTSRKPLLSRSSATASGSSSSTPIHPSSALHS